jgi:hypothetical protein
MPSSPSPAPWSRVPAQILRVPCPGGKAIKLVIRFGAAAVHAKCAAGRVHLRRAGHPVSAGRSLSSSGRRSRLFALRRRDRTVGRYPSDRNATVAITRAPGVPTARPAVRAHCGPVGDCANMPVRRRRQGIGRPWPEPTGPLHAHTGHAGTVTVSWLARWLFSRLADGEVRISFARDELRQERRAR